MPTSDGAIRVAHLALAHSPFDVRIFEKQCKSLAGVGYDVHLIAPEAPDGDVVAGVAMHSIGNVVRGSPGLAMARRLRAMLAVARKIEASIYHLHEPELIPVGLVLKRLGAVVVYDAHEEAVAEAWSLNKDRPIRRVALAGLWAVNLAAARAAFDAFVAATPRIAEGFPAHRTVEVRNYPRIEIFSGSVAPSLGVGKELIFAGLISETRGAREMLDLVAALPKAEGIRLRLLGRIEPRIEGTLRSHPGWERVNYGGQLAWPEVARAYGTSLAGLLLYEPTPEQVWSLPVKLFEYLLSGLPVIASDIPYWRELLEGNPAVLFVPHGDTAAAAVAAMGLARDVAAASRLGALGQSLVVDRFNWESEARKLVALYERLASRVKSVA